MMSYLTRSREFFMPLKRLSRFFFSVIRFFFWMHQLQASLLKIRIEETAGILQEEALLMCTQQLLDDVG